MKRTLLAACLCALTGCAGLQALRGHDPLNPVRAHFTARAYEKVLAQLPESKISELPRWRRAEAYHLLGKCYELTNKPAKALQIYQLGAGIYPKDLNLLSDLAEMLRYAGLPGQARPYYLRILAIHPNNAGGHLGIAEIYRSQGYLSKAVEHYEKTLQQWGDNPHVWRSYAQTLADAGRLDEASRAILSSLELLSHIDSRTALARIERRRGHHETAYINLTNAIAAAPDRIDLLLEKALWLLEDARLDETLDIAQSVLAAKPSSPLARWLRASVALRRGNHDQARVDLRAAAAASHSSPFLAKTARSMLAELEKER
ncbi:MAG: tetratricopeptide repeat protein [Elusimicrobiota bacterium]